MSPSSDHFKPNRLTEYSESTIIAEIQRVVRDEFGGVVPSRDQFDNRARVSRPTIAKCFGTYRAGILAAGFSLHKQLPRHKISMDEVLTNLREVLERANGEHFSQAFYRSNGGRYCEETVKRRLGVKTWSCVLTTIGAAKRPRIVHTVTSDRAQRRREVSNATNDELFKEIGRIWQLHGRRPSYGEFIRRSHFGMSVFRTRYGSWTKAIEAFCREKHILEQGLRRARPTEQILLNELRAFQARRPGEVVKYDAYRGAGGTFSRSAFVKRFGSWTAAVNAAGGVSGEQARHSKDELFDEVQRLWVKFGRQPKQTEMWKDGNFSPKCYARTFGSWTAAIHAFCTDRGQDSRPVRIAAPAPDGISVTPQASPAVSVPIRAPVSSTAARRVEHRTGRTVSLRLRFQAMKRDGFACTLCGRTPSASPGLELHVDHVTAYSRGGETSLDNLQTLCRDCNVGKSDL